MERRDEEGGRQGTHLVLVVVGDGEARGVLGLGPLAERGEHAPDEAALVPAEVEPGDRGGGGREERRGEEDDGAARHHRRHRGEPTTTRLPAGWFGVGVWRLAALRLCCLVLALLRTVCVGHGGRVGLGKAKGNRVVEGTATRDPIGAVSALGSGGG